MSTTIMSIGNLFIIFSEYYNMQIRWIDNDNLAVTWGTRAQNELYIMIYNITAGTEHQVYKIRDGRVSH